MFRSTRFAIFGVAVALVAVPAVAQPPQGSTPFHGEFQARVGGYFPSGGGDFWTDTREVFTLDASDFDGFILGLTYVTPVNRYLEVGFNADFYGQTVSSEYRDWVDGAGFPILHDTKLRITPLMIDLRIVPGGRFSDRGSYLKRKPVFYFGGGVGANYWQYEEVGDFLDFSFDPPDIITDRFTDDGWAFAADAVVGLELPLGQSWGVILEGRYLWSEAELEGDFAGLGTIQFDGPSAYVGVGFSF